MKTTEMIAKVKDANELTILSVLGTVIQWDSMRDLGHTLYTLIDIVQEQSGLYRLFEKSNGALILAPMSHADIVGDHKISYPLEFDSFGELENWSKVTEEEATLLLTKAPAEPINVEPGVNLFKQVFDALGLKYDEHHLNDINDDYAQFYHNDDGRSIVNILFYNGLVQVINEGNSEPASRLKITLVSESNEPCTGPDTRTGHEVKSS